MGDVVDVEAEDDSSEERVNKPAPVDATPIHFVYTKRATKVKFALGFAGWLVTQHVKGPGNPVRDLTTGLPLFTAPEIDAVSLRKLIPLGSGTAFNLLQCHRDATGALVAIEDAEAAYCELAEPAPQVTPAPTPAAPGPSADVSRAAMELAGKAMEESRQLLKETREALVAVTKVNREHATALLEAFAPRVKLRENTEGAGSSDELSESDNALVRDVVEMAKPVFAQLAPDAVQAAKRWLNGTAKTKGRPDIDVTPKESS